MKLKFLEPFQNYFKRRDMRILKGQIQIAQAKIRIENEVLQMKEGRQRKFELASIEKAKRTLPYLRDRLADCRKDGFE
ncbi:MAG: hypothetical protein IIC67_08985 [Thaumarchaeota archaeon]|nr:hypothetical protein [Nitrososphaerota archaeon]